MKLNEIRDSQDIDSDVEERQQLAEQRMRLKKNISATGNYTLSKVLQPSQSAAGGQNSSSVNVGGDAKEDAGSKIGGRNSSIGASFKNASVEKFKKNNLTASNPIIGAPLGDKSQSMKQLSKLSTV